MKPGNAARAPVFAARFANLALHRLKIDDWNLKLIENSIRRIAAGHRQDAERWTDPSLRSRAIECVR